MLVLHLSDIHFREPECNGECDPQALYRDELTHHLARQVHRLGEISAVFVTGDIAYKGHPDEYAAAKRWFNLIAAKVGCVPDEFYIVPGNHDVNRAAFGDLQVRRIVEGVKNGATEQLRERALLETLQDEESVDRLLEPLATYNRFAVSYDCAVTGSRPWWNHEFHLSDGVRLIVRGMTSTFLSGVHGDDKAGELYLGAMQTGLAPHDDAINLALSHHPVDWFSDAESIEDRLLGRPNILLCGHKHRQRGYPHTGGPLVLSAGAVNPERGETGAIPAYNLLEFKVEGHGTARKVRIRTWQYDRQPQGATFRAIVHDKAGEDLDYFDHDVAIPILTRGGANKDKVTAEPIDAAKAEVTQPPAQEAIMSLPQARHLNRRFWNLAHSKRRSIMVGLGQWPTDKPVEQEYEVFRAAIRNLAVSERLDELDRAIKAAEETD